MSRFLSSKYDKLVAYVPGEQPKERQYIKLNTNESPFPPSEKAIEYSKSEAEKLMLYSDPECKSILSAAEEYLGIPKENLIFTNGSDEILNFAFMAFCDKDHPVVFPDITYGFYPVFANLNNIPYTEIPLKEDFTIDPNDYIGIGKNVFIANPNAPTGIFLPLDEIEKIVKSNPDNIIVIDEAYVDFGGESAASLINRYGNLLVTRTFSKSYSLAGARLGFGIASKELIADLNTIRYSTNPYNVNRMTMASGVGALSDKNYFEDNVKKIIETRAFTKSELEKLGFFVLDSKANFLFAKSDLIGGKELYLKLKEDGILVRHFDKERIRDYNRITIGSENEMKTLINLLTDYIGDLKK